MTETNKNHPADAGPVDCPVRPLVPCPLCGAADGYRLQEGNTYRWWDVRCGACADLVAECRSDGRTDMGRALPKRWPAADAAWNEAGRYAQQLMQALQEADTIMGHDDAATEWRERWAHLWPNAKLRGAQPCAEE